MNSLPSNSRPRLKFKYGFCPTNDNEDDRQNGRRLWTFLVIYYPISSKFHIWTTFIKLLYCSCLNMGFVRLTIIKIVVKMPLFTAGIIVRGPLSEYDCSSYCVFIWCVRAWTCVSDLQAKPQYSSL